MIFINQLPPPDRKAGMALFKGQVAAQTWVRQQLRDHSVRNYFVGFRNIPGDHGHTYGIMFGRADWTDRPYVKDIFPNIVH